MTLPPGVPFRGLMARPDRPTVDPLRGVPEATQGAGLDARQLRGILRDPRVMRSFMGLAPGGPPPEAPGGIGAALNRAVSGAPDRDRSAIMAAGLTTLANASRPGASALGSIAQGLAAGQQVGAGNRAAAQQEALAAQEAEEKAARVQELLERHGGVNPPMLRRMFIEAVGAGEVDAAKAIGQVLESMDRGPASPTNQLQKDGINPDTGEPEQYLLNPQTGAVQWLGIRPTERAPVAQVNLNQRERQGMTEAQISQYDQILGDAVSAEGRMDTLGIMESLLDSGMPTGGLESMTLDWRNLASGLGMANTENLGKQQLFEGLANKIALEMKGNMTGQMSDRDIIFLQRQAPRLANTVEGNRLMIQVLRRFAQRKIDLADLQDGYLDEHGTLNGFRRHRARWVRENPMSLDDIRAVASLDALGNDGGP